MSIVVKMIFIYILVMVVAIGIVFQACDHLYKRYDIAPDNVIEELAEDVIESKTGIDIDISPLTPEHQPD